MEELRQAALAYHTNLPSYQKHKIQNFFQQLDVNGDGKVSFDELTTIVKKPGMNWTFHGIVFKKLDADGDGYWCFEDALTYYYLKMTDRLTWCDDCGTFLKGPYFTCGKCYGHKQYDLCSSCYGKGQFQHDHNRFFDIHEFLTNRSSKKGENPNPVKISLALDVGGCISLCSIL